MDSEATAITAMFVIPLAVAVMALVGAIAFYRTRKRPDGTVSSLHTVFAVLLGLVFLGIAGCYGIVFLGSMG